MLLLDNRIGSKHLLSSLQKEVEVSLERLEFGDVAFTSKEGKAIGIEIKSIGEFLSDVISNRFTGYQVPGLLDTFDWVYVVVEGLWKRQPSNGIGIYHGREWRNFNTGNRSYTYRELCKRVNSLSILGNIRVIFTASQTDTIELILSLHEWWSEGFHHHKTLSTFYSKPPEKVSFKPPSLFRRMMKEVDGLGWERTKLLEEKYPSVQSLLQASEKELAQIPGIGKVVAREIYHSLR